jgi:hypothetical protein
MHQPIRRSVPRSLPAHAAKAHFAGQNGLDNTYGSLQDATDTCAAQASAANMLSFSIQMYDTDSYVCTGNVNFEYIETEGSVPECSRLNSAIYRQGD